MINAKNLLMIFVLQLEYCINIKVIQHIIITIHM